MLLLSLHCVTWNMYTCIARGGAFERQRIYRTSTCTCIIYIYMYMYMYGSLNPISFDSESVFSLCCQSHAVFSVSTIFPHTLLVGCEYACIYVFVPVFCNITVHVQPKKTLSFFYAYCTCMYMSGYSYPQRQRLRLSLCH